MLARAWPLGKIRTELRHVTVQNKPNSWRDSDNILVYSECLLRHGRHPSVVSQASLIQDAQLVVFWQDKPLHSAWTRQMEWMSAPYNSY